MSRLTDHSLRAKELYYVAQAVTFGQLAGDGHYTQACAKLLQDRFDIPKVLLTPSCTAALEMAAALCNLETGDEVIMPSYTFVSTAAAFVREGATPVFVDVRPDTLNIDENLVEEAITDRTKAICVVHYAGVACEMDKIMALAAKYNLLVIEDAAQGVNAFYKQQALGSIGDLGCYSFHETKNYICGEGGALCINNPELAERSEVLRDKGTNRQRFLRGQVDKYTWVDVGSSYVPSELCSAFLYGQLEEMDRISEQRKKIYERYRDLLAEEEASATLQLPFIPDGCHSNYHLFFIVTPTAQLRMDLLDYLRARGVNAVFHYIPLHESPMGKELAPSNPPLPVTEDKSSRLLRLPFFHDLQEADQEYVVATLREGIRETFGKTESRRVSIPNTQ